MTGFSLFRWSFSLVVSVLFVTGCTREPERPLDVRRLTNGATWVISWREEWVRWAEANSVTQIGIEVREAGCEKVISMKPGETVKVSIDRSLNRVGVNFVPPDGRVLGCSLNQTRSSFDEILIFPRYSYNSSIAKATFDSDERQSAEIPLK